MHCVHDSSRKTGRLECGPLDRMQLSYTQLTARGLARSLLAGDRALHSLEARARAVLEGRPAWVPILIAEVFPLSASTWARITVPELAARIEASQAWFQAGNSSQKPVIRRWILRLSKMNPAPMGLDHLPLPCLDHSEAVARWLGIDVDTLGWFTLPAARRRKRELHQQHYAFALVPKNSGGGRLIEAPRRRLKALQTHLLHDLLDKVPVHEACHGFVAGRSVLTHARQHLGQEVVLHFDLKNFFNSIRLPKVRALFRTLGYPPGVAQELATLCTVSTPEPVIERLREDGWLDWHQAVCLRDAHLAQGAPSSPMLANLCAFQLDLRLDGLAHAFGACYSRYADDLVFSGPMSLRAAFGRLEARVARAAREEGYQVNHRKTRLSGSARRQQVCGVVVNQRPNVPRVDFDRLRAELHQCALHGPATQNRKGVAEYRAHLRGRIDWVAQLNPAKAQRLEILWGRIDWS